MPQMPLGYVPEILPSLSAICQRFGVGEKQVRAWIAAGAPIAVEGEGKKTRYSAETLRLQLWREASSCQRMEAYGSVEG